nr:GTP-binding protein Di-Ras3 isoform X1 [Podarcis muralis]
MGKGDPEGFAPAAGRSVAWGLKSINEEGRLISTRIGNYSRISPYSCRRIRYFTANRRAAYGKCETCSPRGYVNTQNSSLVSSRASNMPEQSNDYRVVVFGAAGVGKSSLVLRFVRGTFRETYIPTVEDTYRQVISCDKSICTLQITDTTGSHQFPAMQRLSISKGHAFMLVYSVTSRQSIEELQPIYEQICQIKGDIQKVPIMLVGNKSDDSQREVQASEGEVLATKWKCSFMETSAKMNYNVQELFQELLNLEKRRSVSLQVDGKKSKQQRKKDKLKGKCSVM